MLRHKLRTSLLLLPQLQTTLFRHTLLDAFMLQSAELQGLRRLAWAKKDSEVLRRLQKHTWFGDPYSTFSLFCDDNFQSNP